MSMSSQSSNPIQTVQDRMHLGCVFRTATVNHVLKCIYIVNSPQDRMHLDCVFSIVADDVCIMMDEMLGEESPTRRLVDEWVQVCAPGS